MKWHISLRNVFDCQSLRTFKEVYHLKTKNEQKFVGKYSFSKIIS